MGRRNGGGHVTAVRKPGPSLRRTCLNASTACRLPAQKVGFSAQAAWSLQVGKVDSTGRVWGSPISGPRGTPRGHFKESQVLFHEIHSSYMLAIEGPVLKKKWIGTSLVVQWLSLCASTLGGAGLIPGWGTRFPHTNQHSQKKKKKKGHGLWDGCTIEVSPQP